MRGGFAVVSLVLVVNLMGVTLAGVVTGGATRTGEGSGVVVVGMSQVVPRVVPWSIFLQAPVFLHSRAGD